MAKHPRYARCLRTVPAGVPVTSARSKVRAEGPDPGLLERPEAPVPDGKGGKNTEESSGSESSTSD